MSILDVFIVLLYFVGMILIGIFANKKQSCSDDYYVAGRSLKSIHLVALWMSGLIGCVTVISVTGIGYSMGITAIWYTTAIAIGCIGFAYMLSAPVKRISQKLNNLTTLPELIEARYDSKSSVVCSIATILANIGFAAAQIVASSSILNVLTGWNQSLCYVVSAVIIIFYVYAGGLVAVTYTDVIQTILIFGGIVIIATPLTNRILSAHDFSIMKDLPETYFNVGAQGWSTIGALALSTIMSIFTQMDSITRCVAAKDAKTAKRSTLYASLMILAVGAACTFIGMAGKLMLPGLESPDNVMTNMIMLVLPIGVRGIVLAGIISAIMSSADIQILTASASLSKDIYQRFIRPNASDKELLRIGSIFSVLVGVLAMILGWLNQDIMDLLLISLTITSAGLFLPFISAFFWKKSCSAGTFVSLASATVISVIWFVGGKVTNLGLFQMDALWPSFGVSAVLYFLVCMTHKQTADEMQKAEHFYAIRNKDSN